MAHTSSTHVKRSTAATALAAACLLARGASAQPAEPVPNGEPRASLLIGVGAGSAPDVTQHSVGSSAAALLASAGVRLRAPRLFFLDATVQVQQTINTSDVALLVPAPGTTYHYYTSDVYGRDVSGAAEVRAGVEGRAARGAGPLLRASAGGGYAWTLQAPFASAAVGLGTRGRAVRFNVDVEHRWLRVPAEVGTVGTNPPYALLPTQPGRANAGATFVRVGLEAPLWR